MPSASPTSPRVLFVAAVLAWLTPTGAHADDGLSYKYEDYRESGGRIGVKTQGAYLEQHLGLDTVVKAQGILDAIAGATPNGQPAPEGSDQVPLTEMHERRKAWNLDVSRQFPRANLAFGFGNSRESDYVSNGWSLNSVVDFNEKNTELLAGIAGTDDKIKVYYSSVAPRQRKHTNDLILGVTQLLDPDTSVTLNVTWGRASGYLADPYKLVQKRIEVFPGLFLPETFGESRPMYREKWTVLAGVNRAFPRWHAAIDASYRYYRDTFGTRAHTVDLAWFQHLGTAWILRPSFRFYDQSAASFYVYNLDAANVVPYAGAPRADGPFYSSDYRLTALRTYAYGVKLIWTATTHLQLDVALEAYAMRGHDGVTPQSAFPTARIITAGAKFSW